MARSRRYDVIDVRERESLLPHGEVESEDLRDFRATLPSAVPEITFSLRAAFVGTAIGVLVCLSNVYYGLQNGHGDTQAMVCALLGFAIFRATKPHWKSSLSPQENALIQTAGAAVAAMPGTAGMIGIIPALEYLVGPGDGGPISLTWFQLTLFSLGLAFFGVIFAMILRRQYIHRERLPFPSAIASAVLIDTLHKAKDIRHDTSKNLAQTEQSCRQGESPDADEAVGNSRQHETASFTKRNALHILACFFFAGTLAIIGLIFPVLHDLPLFGYYLAKDWMWTINLSPGMFGQGMVTGPIIPLHMLAGAIVGWAILSPIAKSNGWAPGPVKDWESGSRGWLVWPSLASLLLDCTVNLLWMFTQFPEVRRLARIPLSRIRVNTNATSLESSSPVRQGNSNWPEDHEEAQGETQRRSSAKVAMSSIKDLNVQGGEELSAAVVVNDRALWVALIACTTFCMCAIAYVFDMRVPLFATVMSVALALLIGVMSVRVLGQTDFIPVSGLGKIAQFVFALIISRTNPNRIIINLVAGAIAEAGAMQAAVFIFDLKTGAQLGANPLGQMTGHLVGSFMGSLTSAAFYKLYTKYGRIPGPVFQIPTGYIWLSAARLAYGAGFPRKSLEFSVAFAIFFAVTTAVKLYHRDHRLRHLLPGGVAFAAGMYNTPSVTLPRVLGGLMTWLCLSYWKADINSLRLVAGGLMLGESLFNLIGLLF